jgi:hypothetical protein
MTTMLPPPVARYLEKRAFPGPWTLDGEEGGGFAGAVVIPALAESEHLFDTLASLAANPPELLARFLVVTVVNHRADASPEAQADNLLTLRRLAAGDVPARLRLAWVDAAAAGRELPPGEGVGLARKLGCDLALPRLDWTAAPLLVCLDADTRVEPTYLPALVRHFATAAAGGAVLPFRHREGSTAAEEAAIVRYELFLRHYVLGLHLAGSPYAFHTVGSAMACTAATYLKAGGMNRRRAAEDFYFLQQLSKTAGVAPLCGTVVHPSPRPSGRVPFGTGRAVGRLLAGDPGAVRFYPADVFDRLGTWLGLVRQDWDESAERLLAGARETTPALEDYLREAGFPNAWEQLRRNHRPEDARLAAFHGWFDALRTLRLLRRLAGEALLAPEEALPPLLARAGLEPTVDPRRQLALLRRLQGAGDEGKD